MKRKKLRLTPKQAEHMLFNVLEIGSRMLVSGAEVQRVENSIYRMCTAYGSETTEVFCMTYMIVVTISSKQFGTTTEVFCMTYMIVVTISSKQFGTITLSRRIHNLSLNLYELLYLNALSRRMCSTLPDMKTVDQKIRQIKALPKYGPIPSMLIYALISSSFTIFFGGSLPDAAISGLIGIGIRCVELLLQPLPLNRFLLVVLLSTVSGCMAASCVYTNAMFSLDKISIGNIMILIPGLMFTNCIREMISENMLSGLTRLLEALFISSSIAIGFAIAYYLL